MSTQLPDEDVIIKVSSKSSAKSVATVIATAAANGKHHKIRAIGAGAVNQASKACAIAASRSAANGVYLAYIIGFDDVDGHDKTVSAVTWRSVSLHS